MIGICRKKNKQFKIALLMPYFGEFPIWFDLYLYSCSKNPFIDFLFYTDCDVPLKTYPNTFFHKISFQDYCKKISRILNIEFAPQSPYKLCDVRPFYGIIHAEDLQDYDFWGYGDVDVVYGDLLQIVSIKRLKKYDIISSHADRIAGHFTIVKKNSRFTSICWQIEKWQMRLKDEYVYGIDEHDFTWLVHPWNRNVWRMYRVVTKIFKIHPYDFFYIPNVLFNATSRHYIKEFCTTPIPKDGEQWEFRLESGEIISPTRHKIPYLHFLFFKKTPFLNAEHYWTEGFWKVGDVNFDASKGSIIFSNQKVEYLEKNYE